MAQFTPFMSIQLTEKERMVLNSLISGPEPAFNLATLSRAEMRGDLRFEVFQLAERMLANRSVETISLPDWTPGYAAPVVHGMPTQNYLMGGNDKAENSAYPNQPTYSPSSAPAPFTPSLPTSSATITDNYIHTPATPSRRRKKFEQWTSDEAAIAFYSSPQSSEAPPGRPTLAQFALAIWTLDPPRSNKKRNPTVLEKAARTREFGGGEGGEEIGMEMGEEDRSGKGTKREHDGGRD